MAWTTEGAFDAFYGEINLPGDHHVVANTRRDWVLQRLRNNGLNVLETVAFGSIPRFTALKEHADVDVMAVLHFADHIKDRLPSQVLMATKAALGTGQAGTGRRNGQAVTVSFQSWPNIDVVPASRLVDSNGAVTGYEIPDMNREVWLPTNPPRHSSEMAAAATVRGSNFRKIIKMIKHWNRRQPVKLQSYHIEVVALNLSSSWDECSWPLYKWFDAAQSAAHFCWHAGQDVSSYLDWRQAELVKSQLSVAATQANTAWYQAYRGNDQAAITAWKSIFGQSFPSYG
jgi:Second Messenger Oligonucleotide or Dinucleotide Synthetase domain